MPAPAPAPDDDDDDWDPEAGEMAAARGLEANRDDNWNGEKFDSPTNVDSGDDDDDDEVDDGEPEAVDMVGLEAA